MADFLATLIELRNGAVAEDCSARLTEVLKAVMETGKKGKLSLELAIEPTKIALGEVKEVSIKHVCKMVEPIADPGITIFFPLKDGRLSRQDPNQMALDLMDETKERR